MLITRTEWMAMTAGSVVCLARRKQRRDTPMFRGTSLLLVYALPLGDGRQRAGKFH